MKTHIHIRSYFTSMKCCTKVQEITEFFNGKKLIFETGRLAKLADGAAVASIGDTSVLVTSVNKIKSEHLPSFMPLTVDYRQKYAAAGRIPSNYLRRELAPSEKEILTSRVIDRSIRPLFPSNFYHDTQLNCQLLAVDGMQEPDVISINAASASLAVSNIPWNGPIGAVRVGFIKGEVLLFPTRRETNESELNLIVTASEKNHIVMLEGSASCIQLPELKKALKVAVKECQKIINSIKKFSKNVSSQKKEYPLPPTPGEEVLSATRLICQTRIEEVLRDFTHTKLTRDSALNELRLSSMTQLKENFPSHSPEVLSDAFNLLSKEICRDLILKHELRCDGRGISDIRPINCEIDLFKPLHGSALFQRGQTQVQCTVAYDSPDKAIKIDPLLEVTGGIHDRNFILHYSFPSFANNELARAGPLSRREVGHGALAAKALRAVLPNDNPFCILLTSTVMESNGSSSMATVCGGSLALMDAGVPVTGPVAGVAMGLVSKQNTDGDIDEYKIITDILGIEDYLGDMDLKIAGTKSGITALQADVKLNKGVPLKIMMESIDEGFQAKNKVLEIMHQTISSPKLHKDNVPIIISKEIPAHKRGALMASGMLKLKKIQAESGVQITWEDANTLSLFATKKESLEEAIQFIDEMLEGERVLDFGAIYNAKVIEVRPQGVIVSLYEGMHPVLVSNSQLDTRKISHPSVLNLEEGSEIKVKYFGRDPTSGQMRLSRRALLTAVPVQRNFISKES